MRGVSGTCGRTLYGRRPMPFGILHVASNGQSLSIGENQAPTTTTQPYKNVGLHDSSGAYDLSAPDAPTLSLIPLVSPQRPLGPGTGEYPTNIDGECDVEIANQLAQLFIEDNYQNPVIATSTCGVGGAPMTSINNGTTATLAAFYECAAIANLRGNKTLGTVGVPFTHGETDGVNYAIEGLTTPTTYLNELVSLQAYYQTNFHGVLGQSNAGNIPMFLCPTASSPGALQGFNLTAWACLLAVQENPDLFIFSSTKYQWIHSGLHLDDYRQMDEKYAQSIWKSLTGQDTDPLWMTSVTVTGSIATVVFNVPVEPIVIDTATLAATSRLPLPHQTGAFSAWANGFGLEAWDNPLTVTGVSTANPSQVTFSGPHGLTTGASYTLVGIQDSSGGDCPVNGTWTVTVTGPNTITVPVNEPNTYTVGGQGFACISITSVAVAGPNSLTVNMGRAPGPGFTIGYATQTDVGQPVAYGLIRDSDPFVGLSFADPIPGVLLLQPLWSNWAAQEFHPVPYTLS